MILGHNFWNLLRTRYCIFPRGKNEKEKWHDKNGKELSIQGHCGYSKEPTKKMLIIYSGRCTL